MKIRTVGRKASVFLILLLFCAGGVLASGFSADVVQKVAGQGQINGKIFSKDGLLRMDMNTPGGTIMNIHRPDKNVMWTVMVGQGMYMEMPFQKEETIRWSPEQEKSAKYLGEETVSGQKCKKYELVEQGETIRYWVSEEIEFPVKVETSEMTMLLSNIDTSTPAQKVFEVPAGHEKMDIPMMPGMGFPPNG